MRKSLLLIPICITACASGPVLIGKNTYMMTDTAASSWASGSSIKAGLYQKANKFCMEQGKELLAIRSRQQDASMSQFGNAELQFKCLEKNDPELKNAPDGLPYAPDVKIEIR